MNTNVLLTRALHRRAALALLTRLMGARSARRAAIVVVSVLIALAPAVILGDRDTPTVSPPAPRSSEQMDKLRADYEAMIAEFEVQRVTAMQAAEEARMQAEMAREIAREKAALAANQDELSDQERRQVEDELALAEAELEQQAEEIRRHLSESHRQMREASRELARAHRDLAKQQRGHAFARVINLGDRAIIGVVLGGQEKQGVRINGVSPDGPAERAGIRQGDIMLSLRGESLAADAEPSGRATIMDVMGEVKAGEELAITVERDGATWDYMVKAETREPRSWQSFIRLADPSIHEGAAMAPDIHVERIEIPAIDHQALAEQVERINQEVEKYRYAFNNADGADFEIFENFDFTTEDFSGIAMQALDQANIWFGMPASHGLKFTAINPQLGEYFKTDRGVLVLNARQDNAFELIPGDVLLAVNQKDVNSPPDVLRALRDIAPDEAFDVEIMRDGRNMTLSLTMPANRFGHMYFGHPDGHGPAAFQKH